MKNKSELVFFGGAGSVTGSNFMLQTEDRSILIDCGITQGSDEEEEKNWDDFPYNPGAVDVLIVTHAHADHIGRIPKLMRDGFRGKIYSTDATRDLAAVMFEDALAIAHFEEKKTGRKFYYDENDVSRALAGWEAVPYHETRDIGSGISLYLKDAGHILGAAIVELSRDGRKIAFSGDLGNSPTPLLRPTEYVTDANYLLMESVYGDRDHEGVGNRTEKLKKIIIDTHSRGGTLVIPAFSIERTQVMLYELNEMVEAGEVPTMPVYLDSPLAIEVTKIYKKYKHYFNEDIQEDIAGGDDIFNFPGLKMSVSRMDSQGINRQKGAKIVIAGSGMSEGGRILYHYKQYLGDPKSTILLVGYQPVGGLGHALLNEKKQVTLFREKIKVRAKIASIMSYSAHMQSSDLQEFGRRAAEGGKLERLFVAMGEPKASLFLVQRLRDYYNIDAIAPEEGQRIGINF